MDGKKNVSEKSLIYSMAKNTHQQSKAYFSLNVINGHDLTSCCSTDLGGHEELP